MVPAMRTGRWARVCCFVCLGVLVAWFGSERTVLAQTPPAKSDETKVKSNLKVIVPQEDADLLIEGKATKLDGLVREFITPELEKGKTYEYTMSVTWQPNNYTTITRFREKIRFKAGDPINVDFTKEDKSQPPDKVVIRWVPTPDDIVAEMIKLADVKKGDVVYEPGPGDGRVLIAAVRAGADKAVGIELDKAKVVEARDAVRKAGLADKIEIKEGDALKDESYGNATVIFMYMGDEFDNAIRPIFEKVLKPGTRIVSHRFKMGDWEPDKTISVTGQDGDEYVLHLWVVKDKKK